MQYAMFSKCGAHSLLCVSSPQNDRIAQGGAKDSCSLEKKLQEKEKKKYSPDLLYKVGRDKQRERDGISNQEAGCNRHSLA